MRKTALLAILFVCLLSLGGRGPIQITGGSSLPAVAGCTTETTDNFSSGTVCIDKFDNCTSCTQTTGSPDALCDSDGVTAGPWFYGGGLLNLACPWTIASGVLRWDSDHGSECDTKYPAVFHIDALSDTSNQWVLFEFQGRAGATRWPGPVFRADISAEVTSWVRTAADVTTTVASIDESADPLPDTDTCVPSEQVDPGDYIGIHMQGTGAGFTADVWINPTGATPTEWTATAAADCQLNPSDISDGSGAFVGIGLNPINVNTSAWMEFDNYTSGTCP